MVGMPDQGGRVSVVIAPKLDTKAMADVQARIIAGTIIAAALATAGSIIVNAIVRRLLGRWR